MISSSGSIPFYSVLASGSYLNLSEYGMNYCKSYCEYCNSQLLSHDNRCSSCGAPKNTYRSRERNYYE